MLRRTWVYYYIRRRAVAWLIYTRTRIVCVCVLWVLMQFDTSFKYLHLYGRALEVRRVFIARNVRVVCFFEIH